MELTVQLDDSRVRRRLGVIMSDRTMLKVNESVGLVVLERTKDFLDEMSVSRHKVADRLGARHSKFYEYASGRMAGSPLNQDTVLADVSPKGSTIAIKNTPGLSRAFGDLHITATRAKALTIPIDRVSHGKRVADLRREGHEVFRPKGTNILAESKGKGKRARIRPLYALVRSVTVPKDEGLLPNKEQITKWAKDAVEVTLDKGLLED